MAQATKAPATKAPPSTPGTFCWNELMTKNSAAATKFYTKLLGWTTREMDMGPGGKYTIFVNQGKDVGGCFTPKEPEVPTTWMSYIAVTNVDQTTKKAQELGAELCHGPMDIPGIGRFSVIADPTGATIALFQGM